MHMSTLTKVESGGTSKLFKLSMISNKRQFACSIILRIEVNS